ncbi:MAG: GAF domain-containing protein [Candidatus Omnitrophota bacterium]|nr:MAG: GAF domain-containing protein [Candidatus Omnitrophota bacterium]
MMCAHALSALISSIFCFFLAFFILAKNPKGILNRIYFCMDILLGFWTFTSFVMWSFDNINFVIIFNKVNYLFAVYQPALFAHLFYKFLDYRKRQPVIIGSYIFSSILAILSPTTYFIKSIIPAKPFLLFLPVPGILFTVFMIYQYLICCIVYSEVIYKHSKLDKGPYKTKLFYLIIGTAVGFIGFTIFMIIIYKVDIFIKHIPHDYFIIGYSAIIAYAIVRHQLMEIEVIIKKTLVFTGLFASVFAMLLLPTFIIQEYLTRGASFGGRVLGLAISGIIIILAMRKIEDFLINVTDKYLFQKKYDYKELLKTFTGEVLTVLDLNKLVRLTVDKLSDIIKIASCGVLLLNKEKGRYELVASQGIDNRNVVLSKDNTLAAFLNRTRSYLSVKHQGKNSRLPSEIIQDMNELKLELAIPLMMHNEMIGILTLGKKKSDEDYAQDDMDILLPLSRTLAIAISNAEMFDELGKTQAEAAQQEKMAVIGTLSAGINHEICNPLGIARGQCEAFLLNIKDGLYKNQSQGELLEKAKKIMKKVLHETDRATATTKRLSNFAKPTKGLISDDINIKNEIKEVLALVGYELKLDKINIVKEIDKNLPLISADKKQLEEVFFNLIRNAAQSIEGKGRITIRAKEKDDKINIEIEDTGHGISEDRIGQIFNPFYTTKEPGKGTGLGLFIVRQVVERNHGRISVRSKVNKGTTFILEFPIAKRPEEGGKG